MLLSDIQQVITPQVWEHIKKPLEGYYFNINRDFFIEHINNYGEYYLVDLRDGRKIVVPKAEDYSDFCRKVFIVYHENFEERSVEKEKYIEHMLKENDYSKIKAKDGQSYRCHNCGKTFSKEMNFRVDGFNRNICPYCERRTIDIVSGEQDSFYD